MSILIINRLASALVIEIAIAYGCIAKFLSMQEVRKELLEQLAINEEGSVMNVSDRLKAVWNRCVSGDTRQETASAQLSMKSVANTKEKPATSQKDLDSAKQQQAQKDAINARLDAIEALRKSSWHHL